jgi:netrin-G1 ligand
VLDVRGNNIRALRNDVFLTMGITNLQRIYCSYCKISEVEPKAFRRLTNLVELDLSENVMREVPSEAWKNAKALMRLNLSGNPIKLIRSGAFQKLQVQ